MTHVAQTTLADDCSQHVQRACECERRLLSAGCHYPHEMWNACTDRGVDHASFADPRHRKLFDVLCACVVANVTPTPWLIAKVMNRLGCPFLHAGTSNDELLDLWWTEAIPTGLGVWASQIAFYSARQRQRESLLQEACDVITDIAPDARDLTPTRMEAAA